MTTNTTGMLVAEGAHGVHARRSVDDDDVYVPVDVVLGGDLSILEIASVPTHLDGHIAPIYPPHLFERATKCLNPAQTLGIVFGDGY